MSGAAAVQTSKAPKPRNQAVRGTYELFNGQTVRDAFHKSDWRISGARLLPDLYRTCGSACRAGVLQAVEAHASGGIYGMDAKGIKVRKAGGRSKYSCNLITSDLAKILGFSKRQILKSVAWLKEQGFLLQKGKTGAEAVQYALDFAALRDAENAADPEEIAGRFASEGAPNAARGLFGVQAIEDEQDKSESSENGEANKMGTTCRTGGLHLGVLVVAGKGPQDVASFSTPTGETRALKIDSDITAQVSTTITSGGDIVLKISAVKSESPAPAPAPPDAEDPAEALSAALATRQLASAPDLVTAVLSDMDAAPVAYFVAELDRQIGKARKNRKPYRKEWLRSTARDAAGMWRAEERARKALTAAVSSAEAANHTALARSILANRSEPEISAEDIAWAEEVLRRDPSNREGGNS